MKSPGLNQTTARRFAKRAQAAFLVMGVLSLTVAVWGSRPRPTPAIEPLERPTPLPETSSKTGQARPQVIDAHGLADRMGHIANPPIPTEKPADTTAEANVDPVPTPGDESVRFLGLLLEPNRTLALLKVGERQRLVAVGEDFALSGDQTGKVRVTEVTADHVTIETDSGPRRIEKSARQGSSVTYLSGATPPARGSPLPGTAGDPASRSHLPVRPGLSESLVVPPPGARIMPNDRRPPVSTPGEHQ